MNFFSELKKDIATAQPNNDDNNLNYNRSEAGSKDVATKKLNNVLDESDEEALYIYDKIEKRYRPFDPDKDIEKVEDEIILDEDIFTPREDKDLKIIRKITFYLCYFVACFAAAFIIWSMISEKRSYKNIDNLRLAVENEKARIKLEKVNSGEINLYTAQVGSFITDEEIATILNGQQAAKDDGIEDVLNNINPDEVNSQSEYYELLSIKNAPKELVPILLDRRTFYSEKLSEYVQLYEKNKEFAGWLDVPGTAISYPIMQNKDNDFYLTHNFDKKKDKFGMLTMDFRCPLNDTGSQYIIYGHNVRDGRLFGELLNYKNESFYKYEPAIMFDTPFVRGMYEIFAVVVIQVKSGQRPEYEYINWTDESTFEKYVEQMKELSLYKCKFEPQYGQPILALVTCEKSTDTGRLVVLAGKNDMQN